MRTAILIGATGLTGNHCLNILLNDDEYQSVTVLTRRSLDIRHDKLIQHIVDFNRLEASSHLIKADDIFCCLGTTIKAAGSKQAFRKVDVEYPSTIAKIASKNGCGQFLVISAPESSDKSLLFYGRAKAEMEQTVCQFPFNGTYIFRPSLLMGKRDKYRLAEGTAIKLFTALPWLLSGSLKKFRPIEAKAVATAMVVAAKSMPAGKQVYQSDQIQAISNSGELV